MHPESLDPHRDRQHSDRDKDINRDLIEITDMAVDEFRSSSKQLKSMFMNQMDCRLSEIIDDVAQSFAKSTIDSTKVFLVSDSQFPSTSNNNNNQNQGQGHKRQNSTSRPANENIRNHNHVKPKLPDKEFQLRQSPLTELLEVPHFRTIHHIFIASLILMFLHAMLHDLSTTGVINLGLDGLLWAFGEQKRALSIALFEHFLSIVVLYPAFAYWASQRSKCKSQKTQEVYDRIGIVALALFFISFISIPATVLWKNPLPFGSAIVVTLEQGRLLMKMYAFVRSNVPKVLGFKSMSNLQTMPTLRENNKSGSELRSQIAEESQHSSHDNNENETSSMEPKMKIYTKVEDVNSNNVRLRKIESQSQEKEENDRSMRIIPNPRRSIKRYDSWLSWESESVSPCPDFTKYLYFLLAPTLIYRDHYPRTNRIRWNYVCWNFAQCVGSLYYANFIMSRFCSLNFAHLGMEGQHLNLKELLQSIFSLMLPGTLCLLFIFFTILHAWQNAFAEMLYFGDRMFYKDWWNCSSFAVYYKTWNILVHDWLYTYIYKDAWESGLGQKFKVLPTILVFFISSLFHEYILCVSFHFFFPAVLVLFGGFGFIFVFVGDRKKNSAIGNVLMWMALMSGTGIIAAAYSMELYVRINCPSTEDSSFFVPRIIACEAIKFTWM